MEIINGRLSGPILLVDVAIHGDELNGVEIVRQLLTKVDPHKLRGTLVAVPVVNVFGFCPPPVITRATRWIRAGFDGILRSHVALGQRVEKDQTLAIISDPLGSDEVAIKAVQGGGIIGLQTLPLVNEGDAIYHLAYFEESDSFVEEKVESYLDAVLDDMDNEIKSGIGKI